MISPVSECLRMEPDVVQLSDMFMMCVCVSSWQFIVTGPFRPVLRETLHTVKWVNALGAVCVSVCVCSRKWARQLTYFVCRHKERLRETVYLVKLT